MRYRRPPTDHPIRFNMVRVKVSLLKAIWDWLRGGAFERYRTEYKTILFGQPGYDTAVFEEVYLFHRNNN